MSTPELPNEQPIAAPAPLAQWGTRATGLLIDIAPILILNAVTFPSATLRTLASLVNLGYIAYLGYLDGETGQTPGKAIMGIRLVNEQGNLIGNGAGIGRKFLHILDSLVCFLGWLLPVVDEKRQTIADKVMATFVVGGVEKKPFSVDLWLPTRQDKQA